jgi:hypothetical protein
MTRIIRRSSRCFVPEAHETGLQAENERLRKLAAHLMQRIAALRSEENHHRPPVISQIDKIEPTYH